MDHGTSGDAVCTGDGALHRRLVAELVAAGWQTKFFSRAWFGLVVERAMGKGDRVCTCRVVSAERPSCLWRWAREEWGPIGSVPDAWTITRDERGWPTLWVCEVDVEHTPPLTKWARLAVLADCHDEIGFGEVRRTAAGFLIVSEETIAPRPPGIGQHPPRQRDIEDARAAARAALERPGSKAADHAGTTRGRRSP